MHSVGQTSGALLVRARGQGCTLPLRDVVETMRPLPLRPLAGMPSFVLGLSVVRGAPVPVVDLGALLGLEGPARTKAYVSLRCGRRSVVAATEGVLGLRELDPSRLEALPPLLSGAPAELVSQVEVLDRELLAVIRTARLVPDDLWATLEARGSP